MVWNCGKRHWCRQSEKFVLRLWPVQIRDNCNHKAPKIFQQNIKCLSFVSFQSILTTSTVRKRLDISVNEISEWTQTEPLQQSEKSTQTVGSVSTLKCPISPQKSIISCDVDDRSSKLDQHDEDDTILMYAAAVDTGNFVSKSLCE